MLIIIHNEDLQNQLTVRCDISGCFETTEEAHSMMVHTLKLLKAKPIGNITFSTFTADNGVTYQSAKLNARIDT